MVERNLLKTILEKNMKIIHIYMCVYASVWSVMSDSL